MKESISILFLLLAVKSHSPPQALCSVPYVLGGC